MLQITIKRNGTITNGPVSFESQELLDSWYATHVESFGEHEAIIEDVTAALEAQKQAAEAQAFLAATDYIVVRAAERGEQLSPEFRKERDEARAKIQ